MAPTAMNTTSTTWLWGDRIINTLDGDHPRIVYAAILATRDGTTPEHEDAAAVLAWTVDMHPPWDGGCPTCGTAGPCDDQRRGDVIALEFLITKSTELVRRSRQRLTDRDWLAVDHLDPDRQEKSA